MTVKLMALDDVTVAKAVEAFLESTGQAHTVTQLQRDLTTTCMRAALIAITPSEAGEGGKTFGWWVETDSADGGRTGQFVRDWSFIETLRSHIPTTKVTPLYTATPPAAEVSLTDAQCDSIYDALDSWAKSLSWQDYALPGHPDDRSAATEVIRAALRPFADENGNG